ncbi:MAG: SDR family oxidoreductase [Xanthomonadaceae bacterium]|nr:SDR family oxidoreductase [Xanthomonadaceae bacterium]MDE1957463.1 SDR family oxidoreductase [Xanthomonadaceae bacterium]MDE2177397.1 SDR family oxidoreductase [Xanthomonadaceae bacterium]MDE2245334.1 SDR family oxidoreductase [Xanthomonadaceae bacterium]
MRTVLITGANRGLGLEFTRQLLAQGLQVIACSRTPTPTAGELAALATKHPQRLRQQPLDVADAEAIAALPARLVAAGVSHLDVLINNAGVLVSGERYGSMRAEDLARSFAINASAPLLLTEALTPLLAQGHAARVLCVSSQLGSIAQAGSYRSVSYAMSKAALNMGMRRLAAELGPRGISVLAMHPGWVRTAMGGEQAPLDAPTSVRGMLAVLARVTPSEGGRFYAYDGSELPW